MIELLDEITEIPFEVFWDKWHEMKQGVFNRELAQKEWFYMRECDRITAFTALAKNHPLIQVVRQPYEYLQYFNLPF